MATAPATQPSWWKPITQDRPKPVSLQDYAQSYLTNMAMRYMLDPQTQWSTAQFLSRDLPSILGGSYGGLGAPAAPSMASSASRATLAKMTPAWFGQLISELDPAKIRQSLPSSVTKDLAKSENLAASQDIDASARWLNEYLKTAQLAAGVGRAAPTRSTLGYVREHLGTLTREAQDEPLKAGRFLTLAENLVNPVVGRAPQTGLFGTARAVQPSLGEYRRAGIARNVFGT